MTMGNNMDGNKIGYTINNSPPKIYNLNIITNKTITNNITYRYRTTITGYNSDKIIIKPAL